MKVPGKVIAWALGELAVFITHMRNTPFIQRVSSRLVQWPAIADTPLINSGWYPVFARNYWTGAAI